MSQKYYAANSTTLKKLFLNVIYQATNQLGGGVLAPVT